MDWKYEVGHRFVIEETGEVFVITRQISLNPPYQDYGIKIIKPDGRTVNSVLSVKEGGEQNGDS